MKRSQFLASLLGVVAAPFVAKEVMAKEEPKCPFNVKLIQERIDHLKKYPLTPDQCTFIHNGKEYYYSKGMADIMDRFVMDFELGLLDIKKV